MRSSNGPSGGRYGVVEHAEASVSEKDTQEHLDRMRRKSSVVVLHEALESVQRVREGKAAIIQRSWRRHKVEKTLKMKDKAARCIQRNYRRHAKRILQLKAKAETVQRNITLKKQEMLERQQESVTPEAQPQPQSPRAGGEPAQTQDSEKLDAESTMLDYGPSPSFDSAGVPASAPNLGENLVEASSPGEDLDAPAARVSAEASSSIPKSPLDIESAELVYEDFLKDVVEDLASQTFSGMLMQWEMIQSMFRKKGLVSAMDWLFTFFTRGEAYFWLDFLETHLFPELKVSFKWPDRYGGGFVFSSAGWINAAPLQVGGRPSKPKAKRDRNKGDPEAKAEEEGGKDLGMKILSYGKRDEGGRSCVHEEVSTSEASGVGGKGTGEDAFMAGEDSQIAHLVSPFGMPNHISSESPSRTGGFNTNAIRPSTVPRPPPSRTPSVRTRPATRGSPSAKNCGGDRMHLEGRTTRSSSRATVRSASPGLRTPAGKHEQSEDLSFDLASARKDYERDRLNLHSAPSLPRSLERRMSPNHPFRPKWKTMQGDLQPLQMTFHEVPGGNHASRSRSSLDFVRSQISLRERKSTFLEEKEKRERVYKTVNSLNELQLNCTNELIEGCLKDEV
ncbi:hypothetical protein HOP50_01g09070 [Chloropicon primus]|uniref:Uncharacterized protein n=1 Tax=Chloropicon primus TaxID=1764295 RepID=A0A5B8MDR2_9CHLO|nr:hypothetical protein A3770_01p09190 [Chloropicon primus]UPQ97612.1 hypothetical protein HOP50_01g09070 [Chloropicon primus]|eukprot:QDZ18401.1 hypothetical protein A3770_01p09190 [Chloropicon primus]